MSKADFLKLAIAALVAYFTAMVSTEHRISVSETRLGTQIELLNKVDENVQWLVKEMVDTAARVRHLEQQDKPPVRKGR